MAPHSYTAYAARDLRWFQSGFAAVAEACPLQAVVGGVNDYTEGNGWWPSTCERCSTGDEKDPYLFYNAAVAGAAMIRAKCHA